MPTYPPDTEFSFERNVAPYASRFFNEIGADSRLSSEARTRLQGSLVGGVAEIEAQRLKLQEERDQGRMRSLAYANGVSDLEDARARRAKLNKAAEDDARARQQINGVLADPNLRDDEKRRVIGQLESQDPATNDPYAAARRALPEEEKDKWTSAQKIKNIATLMPPEVLQKGDPAEIGWWAEAIERGDERQIGVEMARRKLMLDQVAEAEKAAAKDDERAYTARKQLLGTKLSFAKDENGEETPWLEPESNMLAEANIKHFAPDRLEEFKSFNGPDRDLRRERLVNEVRTRVLLDAVEGHEQRARQATAPTVDDAAAAAVGPRVRR